MKIGIGAAVVTGDGKVAGKVQMVIIDPDQNKVTHLVVETGFLLGRSIVISRDAIIRANEHKAQLKLSEKELGEMPDFLQTGYAAPPRGWLPPLSYPAGSVLWPGGYVYAPLVIEQETGVPEGSVEVDGRTEAFALDGKVGMVERVVVDPRTGEVTGFFIGENKQKRRRVFVPVAWVAAAGGGRLSLNRTRAETLSGHGERKAA